MEPGNANLGNSVRKFSNSIVSALRPEAARYEVTDSEIPGLKLRVSPSGAMTYALIYRNLEGKKVRYTIGRHGAITPTQARKLALAKLAQVRLGEDPQEEKRQRRRQAAIPTLGDFIEKQYLPWFQSHYKARSTPSTLAQFQPLHEDRLDQLTAWKLEKWRKSKLDGGIKPGTCNRHLAALKAALNRAVEWGLIPDNPAVGLKSLKEDSNAIVRYLSADEEKRLREAMIARDDKLREGRRSANRWREARGYESLPTKDDGCPDHLTPMVLLSINTGMRQGEVFNLTWPDVDLGRAVLTVKGATAKSGKTRHIPLNTEAREALRSWQRQQSVPSGYVFPGKQGGRLNNVKKAWQGLLAAAKIKDFRWHDMRHHFASKLVMAGVDINTVRELLGHSDIKMTLRYAHLAPEHKAAAVARLVE